MRLIIFFLLTVITNSFLFSENLHKNFKFSQNELKKELENEKPQLQELIFNNTTEFLNNINEILKTDTSYLKLVDKTHKLSENYVPLNLVNLTDYNLNTRYKEMLFIEQGINDFVNMSKDALKEDIDLFIASTYRSYSFQDQIFTNMKNYHGEEKAATIVAYPGASQHQLGTAIDFGSIKPSFAYTPEGEWLLQNAWKYGFTLSYPKGLEHITTYMWEPWHYRYIGKNAAILQKKFFNDIQQDFLIFWDKYALFFNKNHIH